MPLCSGHHSRPQHSRQPTSYPALPIYHQRLPRKELCAPLAQHAVTCTLRSPSHLLWQCHLRLLPLKLQHAVQCRSDAPAGVQTHDAIAATNTCLQLFTLLTFRHAPCHADDDALSSECLDTGGCKQATGWPLSPEALSRQDVQVLGASSCVGCAAHAPRPHVGCAAHAPRPHVGCAAHAPRPHACG
jgi:hypothetical protein